MGTAIAGDGRWMCDWLCKAGIDTDMVHRQLELDMKDKSDAVVADEDGD